MTLPLLNPLGWALFEELTSAQMNILNSRLPDALDGGEGGDYAPTNPISLDMIASTNRSALRVVPMVGLNNWHEDVYGFFTAALANPRLVKGTATSWEVEAGGSDMRGGAYDYTTKTWIFVGNSDQCFISYDDGASLSDYAASMASSIDLQDVAAKSGDSTVVAVGQGTGSNHVYKRAAVTSGAWAVAAVPGTCAGLYSVAYDPAAALFVAVGDTGSGPYVATADSAASAWTERSPAFPASFAGKVPDRVVVGYTGSAWATVASTSFSSHTKIARSTDGGVTWADCTTDLASDEYCVAANGFKNGFVAVGRNTKKVYTSSDGDTWTFAGTVTFLDTIAASASVRGAFVECYGPMIVVAGTVKGAASLAFSGDDGANWYAFRPVNPSGGSVAAPSALIADNYADGSFKLFAMLDSYLSAYDRIPG